MNFPQQQPPGPFPFLDEIEQRVHPFTGYGLSAVGAVGGFFYGLDHPHLPLVVFVILGLLGGLLAVALLKHLVIFLIGLTLVIAAGVGSYWLLGSEASLRRSHTAPTAQAAPAMSRPSQSLLDDLRKAVE